MAFLLLSSVNIVLSWALTDKEKLYGPFLWMGSNCLKALEPLRRDSLLLTTQFAGVLGTQKRLPQNCRISHSHSQAVRSNVVLVPCVNCQFLVHTFTENRKILIKIIFLDFQPRNIHILFLCLLIRLIVLDSSTITVIQH